MQRLRTVTSLDVSAVEGHHAMPAALLFYYFFFVKMAFLVKNAYYLEEVKGLKISTKIKTTILVSERECLIKSPD